MAQWFRKSEAPQPPVLDRDFLARLASHIGAAEVRELVADGLLELSDRLDLLRGHAERGDVDSISLVCHDVAGSAGHLGLSRLSRAAVEACRLCREDPPAHPALIIAGIESAREESLAAASAFTWQDLEDDGVVEH